MEILEHHVVGKYPDKSRCEDRIAMGPGWVAVIDGATDKTGLTYPSGDGSSVSGGVFAARAIADILEEVALESDPVDAVSRLADAFQQCLTATLGREPADDERPAASIVVLNETARLAWRVGDCSLRIGATAHPGGKKIDRVTADFRAALLHTYALKGPDSTPGATLEKVDPGREAILPLLRRQGLLANTTGEFGYGVVDGRRVPEQFIEVFTLPQEVCDVVLASDGYPTLPASLTEAESELDSLLSRDPDCVGPLRSTKGMLLGQLSFDDRAWVRVRLDPVRDPIT